MNRLNTTLLVILMLLLVSRSVFAEVLRWPLTCQSGELVVKNSSTADVRTWLQKSNPSLVDETEFLIKAKSTRSIQVTVQDDGDVFSLLHFKNPGTIQATFFCKTKRVPAHSLEGGVQTYRRSYAGDSFWVQNLFADENVVSVEYLNINSDVIAEEKIKMKSLGTYLFYPSPARGWKYLRMQGQARFAGFNLANEEVEGPNGLIPQKTQVDESAAYFEVRSQDDVGDSFIAKISDGAMIAKAREQIANPKLQKILFAKIQKGHAGYNRNWSKIEKPFWSWSINEVTNIADLGSTSCNGLPQAVEDRADFWIENPGRICFWSYRIRRELKPSEVAAGAAIR